MVNRHQPHVLVLPEDDANRQIANGFLLELEQIRQVQLLNEAGGWIEVLDRFESEQIAYLGKYRHGSIVLLIDFDCDPGRLSKAKGRIPEHLINRVFILGAWAEPEKLKPDLGSYETIGRQLAMDCRYGATATWGHELLRHNSTEVDRMREQIRPILFEE